MKDNIVLPEFNPNSTCEKCNHTAIQSRFGRRKINSNSIESIEYIQRTCDRCGFRWDEKPVNTKSMNRV